MRSALGDAVKRPPTDAGPLSPTGLGGSPDEGVRLVARALLVRYPGTDPAANPALALDELELAVSKLAATELALMYHRSFGVASTVVRPFIVYGEGEPGGRLIPAVFNKSRAGGGPVDFTSGEQVRDFVSVEEVVDGALRAALEPRAIGEVLNLGTGVGVSVREAVTLAIAVAGGVVVPNFGGIPSRRGEPLVFIAEMTKTNRVLGWAPRIQLHEGLRALYGVA